MSQTGELNYFYCFRQNTGSRPGGWIACGPFDSNEEAMRARQRDKAAWDADVSTVFTARSKREADEWCAADKIP